MENKIFKVKAGVSRSIVLREDEIWLSEKSIGNIEKFEKAVNKTGLLKTAYKIPLSSVFHVSYNEASEKAEVEYINEKGKKKFVEINFNDKALSNQFGEYLGEKLGFEKTSTQENRLIPLLLNSFYLVITVFLTVYFGTHDSSALDSGSRKGSTVRAIMKLIVDTVGHTGVFIIGGLISILVVYNLYKRFKNPSNEVSYKKQESNTSEVI